MDIDGQKRSDNFEDRGAGSTRSGGGGLAGARMLSMVVQRFGIKGAIVAALLLGGVYMCAPGAVKQSVLGTGGGEVSSGAKVCEASEKYKGACDFSRVVLASTEKVWSQKFSQGALPKYSNKRAPANYPEPTLVVFSGSVSTGCGSATSAVGPFYCPADAKLYIDPGFYDEMARKLKAPGDFAQAYVIAHEVGHHIQNLIGSIVQKLPGESKNQSSVRVELQADCLAGVWGHSARSDLKITNEDLAEATQAAHSIGDDALGHSNEAQFTHGSSEQRIRWFRRGFESGDATQCDTFAVRDYKSL